MSKIPLNIYGDPLSAFYGLDVLGDSHSLQEAWIIVDNASSPWISSRLRVQLSRVSGISSQWDNERTLDTLPGNFPQTPPEIHFQDDEPQTVCLVLCVMHDNTFGPPNHRHSDVSGPSGLREDRWRYTRRSVLHRHRVGGPVTDTQGAMYVGS
jgi:hypothetical protein